MDITYYHFMEIKEQLGRIEKILTQGVTTKTWIDIKEAADYSSLSVSTIIRAIAKETLKASRRTGKLLFKRVDLDKFLTG